MNAIEERQASVFARDGDTVVVHSMDRLARNLYDVRVRVQGLTRKGVRVEFVKESQVLTREDSPNGQPHTPAMGAFAEFERSLITERSREGVTLPKQRGACKGRNKTLERTAPCLQRRRCAVAVARRKVPHRR